MLPLIPLVLGANLIASALGLTWYFTKPEEERKKMDERFARAFIALARTKKWIGDDWSDDQILSWLDHEGVQRREEIRWAFERVAQRMFDKPTEKLSEAQANKVVAFLHAEALAGKGPDEII